ncbi:MAG: diacylglycerol kinase family protein [Microvirga sp.]
MMQSQPRVAVLLNASAGTLEVGGGENLRDALAAVFEQHGISATLQLLAGSDLQAAAEQARQHVKAQDLDALVVGGGDGSIRTVAHVLAGTGVPLGILPLGTLNHFARDLGIPTDVEEAIALIAAGETRYLDVGEVNGATFINNSSIGLYPYLVLDRERRRRRLGLSKWTAMILAGFRVLRYLPISRLSISTESSIEPCRSPSVFVGNNEYNLTTPAFGRRERLDSGELCIYVAKAQSRLALVRLAGRAVLGLLDPQRDLRAMKVPKAEIRSRSSRLLVALDGEVEVLRPPLSYRMRPGALCVFIPPASSEG